jgi:hypothetical protein
MTLIQPMALRVEVENFKSIRKMGLELDDLTILVGPPAAGKSNILDALAIIGYLHRFKVLDREYKNSAANLEPLSLSARFKELYQLFRCNDLTKSVRIMLSGEVNLSYEISYTAGAAKVMIDGKQLPWDLKNLRADPMNELQNFVKTMPSFESRLYGFDRYYLLTEVVGIYPPRALHTQLQSPSTARDTPSSILSEVGWNAPHVIRKFGRSINEINEVLKEHLDEKVELKVRRTGEALIFDNDFEMDIVGVSDAVLRVLYTLLALDSSKFYVKYYGLEKRFAALLEEPEAHVFPYFLNILADHISEAVNSIYVVVTTHNPIFASQLCDRVERAKIYYVYRGADGFTCAKELDVGKMARDLATVEDILMQPPSEVVKRYVVEAAEGVEGKTSAS